MKKLCAIVFSAVIFILNSFSVNADTLSVSAKSAILIDAQTGRVIYEKNAYEKRPMASTTKIMTTLLALEYGDLETYFTVDSEAIKVEGSSMGLCQGDMVRLIDLCYGMMLPSGNDAANATAVRIGGSIDNFVALMNDKAQAIGMKDTHFVTPSGLDDYTDEHYSTAYDMALLTRVALENEKLREICGEKYGKTEFGNPPFERWLTNTNKLLSTCDGVFGVKTGFTDKAKRCLVSACERNGVTLICVTLNASDDWNDHMKLYNYGFSEYKNTPLPAQHQTLRFSVVGGDKSYVDATLMSAPTAPLSKGELDRVKAVYRVNRFLYAPVNVGDVVGEVSYYLDDLLICKSQFLATSDVFIKTPKPKKENFIEKLFSGLKGLF